MTQAFFLRGTVSPPVISNDPSIRRFCGPRYRRSPPCDHSRKRPALVTATLMFETPFEL